MEMSKDTAGGFGLRNKAPEGISCVLRKSATARETHSVCRCWGLATIGPHPQVGPARRLLRTLQVRLAADGGGVANAKIIVTPRVCCDGGPFHCSGTGVHGLLHARILASAQKSAESLLAPCAACCAGQGSWFAAHRVQAPRAK